MNFLQSEQWRKFQEAAGRRTFLISDSGFHASIIEHELPLVGKYFYIPRGPVCHPERSETKSKDLIKLDSSATLGMTKLLDLAKKEKAGWVRIDVDCKNSNYKIIKAPHDMQPKEVFVIDISKSEEELLTEMKSKTRYNIKLAEKKEVKVFNTQDKKYIDEFLRLVKITAERDKIMPHPEEYYRQMFAVIPEENIKLYVAEYENKIIVANIVIFYGDTATYLHGASDNEYRNVMAPYLLQWQQILDAKKNGCTRYDFGGIKTGDDKSWSGITKFKSGFSPNTQPVEFSGSYDIVINPMKYYLYRSIQKIKSFL